MDMDGTSNKTSNTGPVIETIRWHNTDGSLEAVPSVEGCWSSYVFQDQPLSKTLMCLKSSVALSHYTKASQNMSKSAWSRKNAARCAEQWQRFIDDNCNNDNTPKGKAATPVTSSLQTTSVAQAFWTTTPFQIMGTLQQRGRDLDNAAKSPMVAPIIGAVTFAGLAVGAALRLRNGFDTGGFQVLAQRLSRAF